MEYYDIYQKRLNRYGLDYQSRMQTKREIQFEYYLARSVYKTKFEYEDQEYVGSFERYKQDETETLHYLLTDIDLVMPPGTILMLPNQEGTLMPWMIYYLERIKASGYNRYIMLRMSHYLKWKDRRGYIRESWAYIWSRK